MASRRFFQFPLICLLIVSLLVNSASALSYVWCVSTDGDHATLEIATAGDCSADCAVPPSSLPASSPELDSAGCGPCLDIPSSHQWGAPRTFERARILDFPVILPQAATAVVSNTTPPGALRLVIDPAPRISEPILHHRTTVLLI